MRQRAHAHAVVDAELQRLHPLALAGVVVLPAFESVVVGQAAELGERVIDVARQIVVHQRLVAASRRGNADFLRSPIEIDPDRVGRKLHERAHAGVRVEQALGVRVAAGGGAERKQARPVAAVTADRNPGPHDDAEAVAQRVQAFDRRVCSIHQAEGVADQFERTGIQPRPLRDADAASQQFANRA